MSYANMMLYYVFNIEPYRYWVGIFYVAYGFLGILLNVVVFIALVPLLKNYFGFRILLHVTLANVVLVFEFGIWAGLVLLMKSEIILFQQRRIFNIVTSIFWYASFYLAILIAFTRLVILIRPNKILTVTPIHGHIVCFIVWFIAIVQSVAVCNIPGYALSYFDPYTIGMVISNEFYIGFTGAYYHILTFGCIIVTLILYFLVGFALLAQSKALKKLLGVKIKQEPISVVSAANKKAPVKRKRKNAKENVQVEKTIILPYFMGTLVALIAQISMYVEFQEPTQDIVRNFLLASQSIVSPLLLLINSSQVRNQLTKIIKRIFKRKSSDSTQTPVTKF